MTLLFGTTAALGVSALVIGKWPFPDGTRPAGGEGIWDWTRTLAAVDKHIRIGRAVMTGARPAQRATIVAHLEERMGETGRAIDRGGAILWFEVGEISVVDRDRLLVAGGGLVDEVRVSGPHPCGRDALRASEVVGWLTRPDLAKAPSVGNVVAWFRAEWPEGSVVHLVSGGCDAAVRRMPPTERQDLWRRARLDAIGKRARTTSRCDVRAVVADGEIRVLLVMPRNVDGERRRAWTEGVRAINWNSAATTARQ